MRYVYQESVQDKYGKAVSGATVTVTLAGGSTAASIYSVLAGGTVDADGIITTGADGTFEFYVDEADYSHSQQFRIVWAKSGFTSETWDYIQIFPDSDRTLPTSSTVDQGDAAIVGTLAWHKADISTDSATITVLPGTHDLTTAVSLGATINLDIKKGGIFKPQAAISLTVYSPENIIAPPQQIIDTTNNSTNPLVFTIPGTVYPEWWGIDGTTDETEIQLAYDSVPVGAVELQGGKTYTLTTAGLLFDDNDTEVFSRGQCTIQTAADIDMIAIGPASGGRIGNIYLNNTHATPTNANVKFNGKAKHFILQNIQSNGGKYYIEMDGTAGTDPGLIAYNEIYNPWGYGTTSYVLAMTGGAVNENKFYGGVLSGETVLETVLLTGNNNLLSAIAFENALGDDYSKFCIYENGTNMIYNCRFEVDSHAIKVNNSAATQYAGSRIYGNYYSCLPVYVAITSGRLFTDTFGEVQTFSGFIIGGNTGSTTVDAESASGQNVLNLTATTGFNAGNVIVIDEGNANEEWHVVDSVSAGASVTLVGNLDNTHAADVAVTTEGSAYGMVGRPGYDASVLEFWSQGILAMKIDSASETAGDDAGFFLYDTAQQTLQQVYFGAADSGSLGGGTGFRTLEVAN